MTRAEHAATAAKAMEGPNFDNPCVQIRGESEDALAIAIGLAAGPVRATHYRREPSRLVLYWSPDESASALPFGMDAPAMFNFVNDWLRSKDAQREPHPDHDGSNSPGWYLHTGDSWGHVDGSFYSIFCVETCWLMHGK